MTYHISLYDLKLPIKSYNGRMSHFHFQAQYAVVFFFLIKAI